ncbi:MAG: hypothetical protein ABJP33_20765 [Pseudoruegeria sp.]
MHRDGQLGMSLLEVLISLLLVSFIAVSLGYCLNITVQSLERTGKGLQFDDIIIGRESLHKAIGTYPKMELFGSSAAFFEGSENSFSWVGFHQGNNAAKGAPIVFKLGILEQNGPIMLSSHYLMDETEFFSSEVLSRKEAAIRVQYLGNPNDITSDKWSSTWPKSYVSPKLVRISYSDSSGFFYPDLMLRPGQYYDQRYISASEL